MMEDDMNRTFKTFMMECLTVSAIMTMVAGFFLMGLFPVRSAVAMFCSMCWIVLIVKANLERGTEK